LCDAIGRVLIADRRRAAALQEFWEFPGGKRQSGESAAAALHRELREELGIALLKIEHFRQLEHDYSEYRVSIDFYLVTAWDGVPTGREGQALRWIDPEDVPPGMLLPADAPLLAALQSRQRVR
jgi:8-oxo-dGTP diphosphatase